MNGSRVVILGASDRPDRYACKAFRFLQAAGFVPVPVHPRLKEIDGMPVFASLAAPALLDGGPIDTVTLYVNSAVVEENTGAIIALRPRRVIMNPGTENDEARRRLEDAGISVVVGCTLVMLRTGQF